MPEQEPPARRSVPDARRNLLRDFFRPSRGQLTVGLALFVTSLIVVITLGSQANQPDFSNVRQAELIQLLDNITAETRRLEDESRELEAARTELISGANREEAARLEAERRIQQAEILAGVVPATGPGVRIAITAAEDKFTAELLLDAVEELRDAGAEVMEIDDRVRLVTASWFATVDGTLQADGTPLGSTIVIEAIGDPDTLSEATRFRGGLVSTIEGERVRGTARVAKVDDLRIDSVVTPTPPRFARPG